MITATADLIYNADTFYDQTKNIILRNRIDNGVNTHHDTIQFHCTASQWKEFAEKNFEGYMITEFSSHMTFFIKDTNIVSCSITSKSAIVELLGDKEFIVSLKEKLKKTFDLVRSHVEWIYSQNGNSASIPLVANKLPFTEMYPFLNEESLESYFDRFAQSDSAILLMIGPPGTGKTSFIRGFLNHTGYSACLSYDPQILNKDYIFAEFIEGDAEVMVMEDADGFLGARDEGNTVMHRFLNVGDGLVSSAGKKIIFSTNLTNTDDIDPALIRPGRCFDILNFTNLSYENAVKLADVIGVSMPEEEKKEYSVAEVFNKQRPVAPPETKMGFI